MTLQDIADRVDRGGSSRVDYQVTDVLRHEILPRFFGDIDTAVGDVFWRRLANFTIDTVLDLHRYPLPRNFKLMASLGVRGRTWAMTYIGNDPQLMRKYAATHAAIPVVHNEPCAYWVDMAVQPSETQEPLEYQYELVLATKPDGVYTLDGVFYTTPDLRQSANNVELDQFIPFEYQHALIALCRADLLADRNGGEDPGATGQMTVYNNWLAGLKQKKSAGRNPVPKFAW